VRLGLFLATVPIGYFIYVLIDQRLSGIFQPYADFELLSILSALVYEVAFWGVAAFAFGCLYAYLPFGNGVLRGAAFSLPFIAANGLSELVPGYQGDSQWLFRSVELLLFTTLLGLLLDLRTVRSERFHWRNLIDLYQVRSLLFGIVNLAPLLLPSCSPLAPLLLAALGVYQQIRAGDPQAAIEQLVRSAPGQFPGLDPGE